MDTSLIKSKLTCTEYLRSQGYTPSRTGRMVSPLRPGASNPTSFHVGDNFFYDFGSGTGGDVIDLAAQLEYGGDIGKAIRGLSQRLGLEINHPRTNAWHDAIQDLCNRTEFYHSKLTEDDRKYLHDRGFTDKTIDDVKIGRVTDGYLRGRLFLPYFKNDYVCYYATRAMPGGERPDSKYMKASLKESEFYENIPWGLPTLSRLNSDDNPAPGTLIISEGYFDALSWYQDGYAVLSAITGRFSRDQLSTVLSACRTADNVLIIYDNDAVSHAGEGFTQSMAEWLFSNHVPFTVAKTPYGIKDVNDYYAAGNKLLNLVMSATPGAEYLTQSITDVKQMEKFVIKLKRIMSKTEIVSVISSTTFPTEVKKSLISLAGSPPLEEQIADEILKNHQLIYAEDVGYYEWNGKIWERISDLAVCSYTSAAYGPYFSTNQRKTAVMNGMKSRVRTSATFNSRPVITFQNGTLDIETGVFRESTPTDFCSIIMGYNYDPSATCPMWNDFIESVTAGVGQRQAILQMIAGYVLSTNCDLQKIFILTGNGANGKTVYLNTLQALFGTDNVSHIEPSGLTQDFQRILLKDSLLNLGADISSDFTKGEVREWLLKLSEGDTIHACYKGKNYINFKPRCKMIFACNSIPKASETAGLERRFHYVKFEMKYVEYPKPDDPFQALRDTALESKLLTELPGIFNWAYHGFTMLLQNLPIPDAPEQAEFERTFLENSDPIVVFISETDLSGEFTREELWNIYLDWTTHTNHHASSRNNFLKNLRRALGNRIIREGQRKSDGKRYIEIAPPDPEDQPLVPTWDA